jgi:glutamate--cysteine ligase
MEVRYLDTPPHGRWIPPVVLMAALFSTPSVVDEVLAATEPAVGRWLAAARYGLADPQIGQAARAVVEIGCRALENTDLSIGQNAAVAEELHRTLAEKSGGVTP